MHLIYTAVHKHNLHTRSWWTLEPLQGGQRNPQPQERRGRHEGRACVQPVRSPSSARSCTPAEQSNQLAPFGARQSARLPLLRSVCSALCTMAEPRTYVPTAAAVKRSVALQNSEARSRAIPLADLCSPLATLVTARRAVLGRSPRQAWMRSVSLDAVP
jgi:hypothetical protein